MFIKWLNIIHTSNISFDITFKDDFIPILGTEQVSQLKGSTKIRAVLAYHAALIELMAINSLLSFKLLILDTPKQHEIHNDDLNNYIIELKTYVKNMIYKLFSQLLSIVILVILMI
ncbi:hypothetical protein TUM17379_36270 [Shewanella algae]|uniref:Uncharacterized protein n=1 Tax=Shewanella algae TaxID=38313 RepID=A0AAD1NPP1_9GAMM|nr:hypothetical protein TUM17379_36270 [Shewanella algae]